MAGRIKQIVAIHLGAQVKDPRLGMVTITDVRITGDLHDATIFYTVYGDEDDRVASAAALESARAASCAARSAGRPASGSRRPSPSGWTRCRTPRSTSTRCWPSRRRPTAQVEAVRQGAQPAGDPDPYRKPREIGEDDD